MISTRFAGYITAKDLETVTRALGEVPTHSRLRDMLDKVDTDHDGAVDFQDFVEFMDRRMEELKEAFQSCDPDEDGFISADELR